MDRLFGVFFILVSAASYGAMPIFACLAYQTGANSVTVLFLRFAIASVLMVVFMAARSIAFPRGRILIALVLMGAIGYAGLSLAYFTALTMIPAGLVAILFYLYPAFVTVLAAIFLKKPLTRFKSVALLMSLVGTGLVVGVKHASGEPLGVAMAITAAILCSVYMIIGSWIMTKSDSIAASTVVCMAAGTVFGGVLAVKGAVLPCSLLGWVWVSAIAVISTALALVTLFAGLKRLDPANASMIFTLEPVVSVTLSVIILGEPMSSAKIMGGMLILTAVIVVARSEVRTVVR